jgi:hypothetical protein
VKITHPFNYSQETAMNESGGPDARGRGTNIDECIKVNVSKQRELKAWLSETTVFLKHADRDPNGFLSPDGLDNQKCSWRRALHILD